MVMLLSLRESGTPLPTDLTGLTSLLPNCWPLELEGGIVNLRFAEELGTEGANVGLDSALAEKHGACLTVALGLKPMFYQMVGHHGNRYLGIGAVTFCEIHQVN
jgi:hypothetical protein